MTDIEFNKSLRSLNNAYKEIFNSIPRISDYACTRDEYVAALKKAVDEKVDLSTFLTQIEVTIDKNILI